MENVTTNRNCVYQTAYHLVWCPKYRHDILTGEVAKALEELLDQVCSERKWTILAREVQPDHIHLFLSIPPSVAVSDAVKILKGTTGRRLFVRFPVLKKRLWGGHLWSPSYYVGTAGHVSADTIKKYIERSEHVTKRR
jgi:putative transposase